MGVQDYCPGLLPEGAGEIGCQFRKDKQKDYTENKADQKRQNAPVNKSNRFPRDVFDDECSNRNWRSNNPDHECYSNDNRKPYGIVSQLHSHRKKDRSSKNHESYIIYKRTSQKVYKNYYHYNQRRWNFQAERPLSHSGIDREVYVTGAGDHLDLWNRTDYEKFFEDNWSRYGELQHRARKYFAKSASDEESG